MLRGLDGYVCTYISTVFPGVTVTVYIWLEFCSHLSKFHWAVKKIVTGLTDYSDGTNFCTI